MNGRVFTADEARPAAEAFAVQDGRILAIGGQDEVLARQGPQTRLVDLQGKRGLPGLIDAHTLLAYTPHAAQAIGLAEKIGALAVGKQAEFIVLDCDVLAVDAASLKQTQVLQTYFAGNKVYQAQ